MFPLFRYCFVGAILATSVWAQETSSSSQAATPAKSMPVLNRRQIQLDSRTITYDRIGTPLLKPQLPPLPPVAEPPLVPPTAAELEAIRQWEAKAHLDLFLSVTRYDNGVSEVHFWYQGGSYVFWSNLNFNHLRSAVDFETPQATYWFLFSTIDQRLADLVAWNAEAQSKGQLALMRAIPILSPTIAQPGYVLISSPPAGAAPEAIQAIKDLHQYYQAHQAELTQAYQEVEAARVAQEAYLQAHPPQPQNTVIQYFPIKSVHRTQP